MAIVSHPPLSSTALHGQDQDKTGIGWTLIGSQSPSRAADSSRVPERGRLHYSNFMPACEL